MSELKTMTVLELTGLLAQHISQDKKVADYKVFVSSDPEGNSYGTIDKGFSLQWGLDDDILVITPYEGGLDNEDIAPIESHKAEQEIEDANKGGMVTPTLMEKVAHREEVIKYIRKYLMDEQGLDKLEASMKVVGINLFAFEDTENLYNCINSDLDEIVIKSIVMHDFNGLLKHDDTFVPKSEQFGGK